MGAGSRPAANDVIRVIKGYRVEGLGRPQTLDLNHHHEISRCHFTDWAVMSTDIAVEQTPPCPCIVIYFEYLLLTPIPERLLQYNVWGGPGQMTNFLHPGLLLRNLNLRSHHKNVYISNGVSLK